MCKSNQRPADVLIYGVERTGIALHVGITDAVSRYRTDKSTNGDVNSGQDVTVSNTDVMVPNGHYAAKYYKIKKDNFQKIKFIFGYESLQSRPFIMESFGYVDPRSLLLLNKLITLAARNMNKDFAIVNYNFKLKLSTLLAKADANAGLARYYYEYDDVYCKF